MNFRFETTLTEEDYFNFNKFHMLKSPYGKKTVNSLRVSITVMIIAFMFISVLFGDFSLESWLYTIPLLILLVLFHVFMPNYLTFIIKGQIKQMKKSGKMPYSKESVIEFYDESFSEATEDNKTEMKYSAIERISVVTGKSIYLHTNNIMAYIIPMSAFASEDEYASFMEFIHKRCSVIDYYNY
ncbi:MAG: YcxB family protein [Clostridia bacterium]|nr:YcxB family protein [Clostridia bacterium]